MRKWIALAVVTLAVLAGVYFGSPYWAARGLKQAAVSGDAARIDAAIDFPAVRESLKAQVRTGLAARVDGDPGIKDSPLVELGMLVMPAIVDRAVDGFVTPGGIAALLRGVRPADADAVQDPGTKLRYDCEWLSLDRVRVRVESANPDAQGLAFVLHRRGFASWKLVRLELPRALFDRS